MVVQSHPVNLFINYLTLFFLFFFNDTATTEIYTLSLHDALPISPPSRDTVRVSQAPPPAVPTDTTSGRGAPVPAPTHVARPPSRARVPARSPAAGAESAAGAPGAPPAGPLRRALPARAAAPPNQRVD